MINKKIFLSFIIVFIFLLTGCNNKGKESGEIVNVLINGSTYKLSLEDNETAKKFLELLPKEYIMRELNGNEKYVYIDVSLPIDSKTPGEIKQGDVYLYGDNCLVIFYKSFKTSYSYTKIGHIDSLPDLGSDDITCVFEK